MNIASAILRPSLLLVPERVVPPLNWVGHIPFAFWIMDVHRPQVFVELGTHSGTSYWAFAQAARDLGLQTHCFAVDTWEGDDQAGHYGEEVHTEVAAHNAAKYGDYSTLLRKTFDEATRDFANGTIDLLHIDGLHTYEAVRHDFETWLPKLSRRGVVLFHDTSQRGGDYAVWKLWAELAPTHRHFEFVHAHGLGVLGVGDAIGPELESLFATAEEADGKSAAFVRSLFELVGRDPQNPPGALATRLALEGLLAEAEDRQTRLNQAAAAYESFRAQRDETARQLGEANQRIDRQAAGLRELLETGLGLATGATLADRLSAILRHPLSSPRRKLSRELRVGERRNALFWRAANQIARKGQHGAKPAPEPDDWFRRYRIGRSLLATLAAEARTFAGPKITVIMPVYETLPDWLTAAIASVRGQIYPNWELICVDDASPSGEPARIIGGLAARDPRIVLVRHPRNLGVAAACNTAIEAATGAYVLFLDHDDVLEPHALFRFAKVIVGENADLIYADEVLTKADDLDVAVRIASRPAFSYDYYLSHPYFVHPVAVRRDLAASVRFDPALRISQDIDFVLRVIERAGSITHIPDILYRWRVHAGSLGHARQVEVAAATQGILGAHLKRRGFEASVADGVHFNLYRTRFAATALPARIAVIIPTRNRVDLLEKCIASIRAAKKGRLDVEIIVVDHESDDPATLRFLRAEAGPGLTVLPYRGAFNFSRINNFAVEQAGGNADLFLFMNNDVEAIDSEWLEWMADPFARSDVGVVGATLLYPDNRIQHAGVVVGIYERAEHAFKFVPFLEASAPTARNDYAALATRDWSAVTAACMAVRASVFREVGGFDEKLEVGFGDTDFCLRVRRAGYGVLNQGTAVLRHFESASRGIGLFDPHPFDSLEFGRRYADLIAAGDPFYSPHLSRVDTDFRLKAGAASPADVVPRTVHLRPLSPWVGRTVSPPTTVPVATGSGASPRASRTAGGQAMSSGGIQQLSVNGRSLSISGWLIPQADTPPIERFIVEVGGETVTVPVTWLPSPEAIPRLPGRASARAMYAAGGLMSASPGGSNLLATMRPEGPADGDVPYFFGANSDIPLPPADMIATIGGGYVPIGFDSMRLMVGLAGLTPSSAILDMGCGCGRVAYALRHYLGPEARYVGFDIIEPMIRWSRENLSGGPQDFRFEHADLFNGEYNSGGRLGAEDYRLPLESGVADVCLANSLFTHMRANGAAHYVREVARVLRPGGRALISCFRLDETARAGIAAGRANFRIDTPLADGTFTADPAVPERTIGLSPAMIDAWAADAGLVLESIHPGFWVAGRDALSFQDLLVLRKPAA